MKGRESGEEGRVSIKPAIVGRGIERVPRTQRHCGDIQAVQKGCPRACAGGRIDPAPRLRQRGGQTGASDQPAKRSQREADPDRSKAAWRSKYRETETVASSRSSSRRGNGALRIRQQDYRHVCARDEGQRHPGYLEEIYGVLLSPDLICQVTDAVMDEVREWQNRPLERL
jgi:hypothetical protein